MNQSLLEFHLPGLREISRELCAREGGSHGFDHSERVYTTSLVIGRELNADLLVLGTAALLHDIGRKEESMSKGAVCHAAKGAELAAELLAGLGYEPKVIEQVSHCIRSHRFRRGEAPATLEAKILYDADKLDSIGAVGIGRAFLFAGSLGACLHNPEKGPEETAAYSTDDTAYREFQVKMSKVKNRMLTDPGRRIALERHNFMEIFFDRLNSEIYGSL